MKIDPYKHKERYHSWRNQPIPQMPNVSSENQKIILKYLDDMEIGANIAKGSPKGGRGYARLHSLKARMIFFAQQFKEKYNFDPVTEATEDKVIEFFSDMRKGKILRDNGEKYKSIDTYARIFRAFWHWHQKINRKQEIEIKDITADLDTTEDKPDWVYLTEEEIKKLAEESKFEYKVLILFLYDSGIRAPSELINIRVSDLHNNCKELHIREETSKTFGRRIKLMISSEVLKEYLKNKKLDTYDQIFDISPSVFNRYLKRLAKKIFGDKPSPAGQKYSELSMYDFRHCSCCYWLPRYKSESALKYRFGWKKSDKIHYYSELLGMRDTISEEDLLIDVTKTELEQRLAKTEKEKEILQERMDTMEMQMTKIMELTKKLGFSMQEQILCKEPQHE